MAWDGFIWLVAAMCYPRDPRRQREAVGTWELDLMAHAKSIEPRVQQMGEQRAMAAFAASMGMDDETLRFAPWTAGHVRQMATPKVAYSTAEAALKDLPGWEKTVADAPGLAQLLSDVERASSGAAQFSGHILILVATMVQHHPSAEPSVARALAILRERKRLEPWRSIPDPRTLKRAWKEWRCAAPLWAGYLVASNHKAKVLDGFLSLAAASREVMLSPTGRLPVLQMASWFRDFGTRFIPRNANCPILPDAECPAMPAGIEAVEPPLAPLEQWAEEAACGGKYGWNMLDWD